VNDAESELYQNTHSRNHTHDPGNPATADFKTKPFQARRYGTRADTRLFLSIRPGSVPAGNTFLEIYEPLTRSSETYSTKLSASQNTTNITSGTSSKWGGE